MNLEGAFGDQDRVRQSKEEQEEADRIALEEVRNRTPAECFALLKARLEHLAMNGQLHAKEDDLEFHLRWQRAREAWLAKHGKPRTANDGE